MINREQIGNLVIAVFALMAFSIALVVVFDTPWNRMLLGFGCVLAWFGVLIAAWSNGVPFLPARFDRLRVRSRRDVTKRLWAVPVWIALLALWLGAGVLVTNGG